MKKIILMTAAICILLAGCGNAVTQTQTPESANPGASAVEQATPAPAEQPGVVISPFGDRTMKNLTDATLSVSFEEGDVYLDNTGKLQMEVKIYTYDMYDAKDISGLKAGDTLITHAGELKVTSVERSQAGNICINGGLEKGGMELTSGGGGMFHEVGFSDMKNWYEVGAATLRVSADFMGYDNADPDRGEVLIYPGDFLVGAVADYNFTPHNTTVRVEGGQIIEMTRRYVP